MKSVPGQNTFSACVFGAAMDTEISDTNSVDHWKRVWDSGTYTFHSDAVHPKLIKYLDMCVDGREHLRMFVPLCGKSVDMKYLYDKGHHIVGVDCSSIAIEEFFSEQNITFSCQEMTAIKGRRYQNEDGRIVLYCCDFFSFTDVVHGQFDFIWDRAAMYALKPRDRSKYVCTVNNLMGTGCVGLIETLDFVQIKSDSPYTINDEEIRELYSQCKVELIETFNLFDIRPEFKCISFYPDVVDGKMWLVKDQKNASSSIS